MLRSLLPDAPTALYEILDSARGPLQPPIRSEIFGPQRFAQHGRSLGLTHRATRTAARGANFFPRIKDNLRMLRAANTYIGEQANTGYDISPAAEWLLDNFHLIEVQLNEIKAGLPLSFFTTLPKLLDEPLAGLPRVYGVAWAFVAHTDGAFDDAMLGHFLCAYQETRELNLSEMWAFPTTLRVVLVENLRRLAEQVAANKAAREAANLCFEKINSINLDSLIALLDLLNARGVGRIFLLQLALRLQDLRLTDPSTEQVAFQNWLHAALPDLAAMQLQQAADQAADNLSVSNAISSLRAVGDADWSDIIARTSTLMQLMLTSPVFALEATLTRDQTLHAIERLAVRSGQTELAVAHILLGLMNARPGVVDAQSVASHWLLGSGQGVLWRALGLRTLPAVAAQFLSRQAALPVYLGTLVGSVGLLLWLLLRHRPELSLGLMLLVTLLALFPASEAVVAVIHRLISESIRPKLLPRLALVNGIPPEHRVMVVIPGMLTGAAANLELVRRLQLHYLANPESNAQFALLTDWADADSAALDSDAPYLAQVVQGIQELNTRYPRAADEVSRMPRFIVLHRARLFSQSEQRWIGWERKRGKLELLIAALAEGDGSAFIDLQETSAFEPGTRHLLTLDSDTQLPPGRLRELVGVAAHPHNLPQLAIEGRTVVSGYGILQPRVATPLPAVKEFTLYHWLFAGQCGIDPYSAASSEIYQDVFAEGTFSGKGLLNVWAVHAVLAQRLPEGQVLSHDLLEGSIARCAAVSDISVIEDAPFHADVAASRIHRWIRGDWQLLPFLLSPKAYRLRAINLWKMLDNLRRPLVAPMSLGLLLISLTGTVMSPWVALVLVYAAFSAGPVMGAVVGFAPSRDDLAIGHFYRGALINLARAAFGSLWQMAQLLQQTLLSLDAITRALYRTFVSHRLLLQWTTAALAQAQATTRFRRILRQHRAEPALGLLLLGTLLWTGTPSPWLASFLCAVWAASPVWTWGVSRTYLADDEAPLAPSEKLYLTGVARDTWRLFERCVGPGDRHLPPDNLQTSPHNMVAHRTSPTNIGLYLLSVACARQFGWIGTQDLLTRLEATLQSMRGLQRYRGHFMNWYDTQSGEPLLPMYVSTVDSGNLSGHLLAVAQACRELALAPYDTTASVKALAAARQRLAPLMANKRSTLPAEQRTELKWLLADHRATVHSARLDAKAHRQALDGTTITQSRLEALALALEQLAWEPEFGYLYSHRRHLFHIGFRVAEHQLDAGFYDLLASESRLTSLLAIAKSDVPVRHWRALGRPFFAVGTSAGLQSWTGSMFEYLMPSVVLNEPYGSVLHEAGHAALREQMVFATAQHVPWGISESAYAASDFTLAYQYAPHGVPRLALRRTPPDELVIAPYATALAVQVAPHGAYLNFQTLQGLGARGQYGFIEALDYSATGRTSSEAYTPVETYMAHHQGMSIVALTNVLQGGAAQRWGMANAHLQAVCSLLYERVPREIPVLRRLAKGRLASTQRRRTPGFLRDVSAGTHAVEPTHVLSNGRYSVLLRANGAGSSQWGQLGITRWRDDALRDAYGSFFYLRWPGQSQAFSITQHPTPDPQAQYGSVFHADRVCFEARWPELQAHTTVWVSPEDDIEFRRVEIRNLSQYPIDVELTSAFEVTLSEPRADEAHPAFSNLFVTAQWLDTAQALWFERKPRLVGEQGLAMAHFLTDANTPVSLSLSTDRQRWQGRNHGIHQASMHSVLAPKSTEGPAVSMGTGLDPACALVVSMRIEPGVKTRLTFATAASLDRPTLHAVVDKYRQAIHVQRASLMSATLTGIRLRSLRISAENFWAMQTLTTTLTQSLTRVQARAVRPASAATEVCDRQLLWRLGISGDRPIILVLAAATQGLGLLRVLSQALSLWSWSRLPCDLVVVNAEPMSYLMPLQRDIASLRDRHSADCGANGGQASTGYYLLRSDELSNAELNTLHSLARVLLHADGRPLAFHVQELNRLHEAALDQRMETTTTPLSMVRSGLVGPPSQGKFDAVTGAFSFDVNTRQRPDRPWINVLSNPDFGAQISEAGGGYTWAVNSRLNQLTAWSNDPVADPPSEWFLLQNSKSGEVWRLCPSAGVEEGITFHITHGQGDSSISHRRGDLEVMVTWCVDAITSVKQIHFKLVNHGSRTSKLRLIGMVEWMMGANRSDRATVRTAAFHQRLAAQPDKLTALLGTQRDRAAGFGGGTAFFAMASNRDNTADWTCDRRELFDARGHMVIPDHFGQRSGDGLDPCAALSTPLVIGPGESASHTFLLGYAPSADAARQLATLATQTSAAKRLAQVHDDWQRLLGATTVSTPDPLFDALVNHWLLYQAVSCRLRAKAGFYQAGGATGFRDQLQDAMAMAWAAPEVLRAQILVCAAHQFEQGDVQHWWHAPLGNGVRTHFSDDLLWLTHACVHYLQHTGDVALLDEQVPFLEGQVIPVGAEDAYFTPSISTHRASVYEHAARALDRSLQVGVHGLPLMGSGDWNDGMNRVGAEGRGESVWLGWFLCKLVADFAPLAHQRGDGQRAERWELAAEGWQAALLGTAWDGAWFKRAFFDDGQPLGSNANPEAKIDLIAQAWSVLSKVAPPDLQRLAMASVEAQLVDHGAGLIQLLTPPLVNAQPSAGYIQAYPPGVRENGGQYSHAGIWALMAQAELARHTSQSPEHNNSDSDASTRADSVYRYFTYLSPAHRASHPTRGPVYGLEPYVMAADVYSQPPYVGRGGWSWYTGAAAWMHRAAIESIFGLTQDAQTLVFQPCLPSHWPQAELRLKRGRQAMRFIFIRGTEAQALANTAQWQAKLLLPGVPLHWPELPEQSCFVLPLPYVRQHTDNPASPH